MRRTTPFLAMAFALCAGACTGEPPVDPPENSAATGSGAPGGGAGGADDGAGGTTSTVASTSTGASTTTGANTGSATTSGNMGPGLGDLGTLVILGDSISDGGGEGPFYYDVLLGELEQHYQKTVRYENHARAGTTTLFLDGQIAELPDTLEGPVAVVITSGGNNMQYNVLQILAGFDQGARDRMAGHIDAALTDLLSADRFGAGVEVKVFEANIYDASDGAGDFGANGCAMPIDAPNGSAAFFSDWNQTIADAVNAHQQELVDFHGHFVGHGFASNANWFADDCIHPNPTGHKEISELFFARITGM